MEKSNRPLGFTLIELMVTLAIVGILVSIGIPSLSNFLKNNTLSTNSSDFIGALNYTRSEAVKRGSPVTMCISNNNPAAYACINNGNWQDGWLIHVGPGAAGPIAAGTLLRAHPGLEGQDVTLMGNGNVANRISYLGTGGGTTGTFVLCDNREIKAGEFKGGGEHARAIVINNTGRVMSIAGNDSRLDADITDCTP